MTKNVEMIGGRNSRIALRNIEPESAIKIASNDLDRESFNDFAESTYPEIMKKMGTRGPEKKSLKYGSRRNP